MPFHPTKAAAPLLEVFEGLVDEANEALAELAVQKKKLEESETSSRAVKLAALRRWLS